MVCIKLLYRYSISLDFVKKKCFLVVNMFTAMFTARSATNTSYDGSLYPTDKGIHRMVTEKNIGKTIRRIRELKGMTLEILAQKTNLTKGYLSRIENSDKAAPVSTLLSIAKALDTRISYIFGETQEEIPVWLIRKKERTVLALPGTKFGYHYESIVNSDTFNAMILTRPYNPHWQPVKFKHEGKEMIFILEGTNEFHVGDQVYVLRKGDCIFFDSSVEHYGKALKHRDVKMLIVFFTQIKKKDTPD